MPRQATCPLGHNWQTSGNGDTPTSDWPLVCPVCGLAPQDLTVTTPEGENTATLAPPPNPPGHIASAETETGFSGKASLPDSGPDLPTIPNYELLEVLGRGGMGVVYKARQKKLNRIVAMKMILAGGHAGPVERRRFQTEVEAVAKLHHPNIVQIYDVDESDGRPFYTFEYVEGGSLAQRLKTGPQPFLEAAHLTETLARAIHVAHQHGIIHRDLKPANVLLTKEGTPKIADFGLAKRLDAESGQTQSGLIMGTPDYMAPEQAGGLSKQIGAPTDIHALGVLLYEQLTGRPPFRTESVLETILKVANEEPLSPSSLNVRLPRDLVTICMKCLQKEPKSRYDSAQSLAEDLRRFQAGESIQARPMGWGARTARLVKKHRRLAVGLVLLVAVVGFSLALQSAFLNGRFTKDESNQNPADLNANRPPKPIDLPADLALVPSDALGFSCLKVSEILKSETIKRVLRIFGPGQDDDTLNGLDLFVGSRPAEIERLIKVSLAKAKGNDAPSSGYSDVTIIATLHPYDRAAVIEKLDFVFDPLDRKSEDEPGRKPQSPPPDSELYESKSPDGRSILFVNDHVYAFANRNEGIDLPALLHQPSPRNAGPFEEALLWAAAGDHDLVAALRPAPTFIAQMINDTGLGKLTKRLIPFQDLVGLSCSVNLKSGAAQQPVGDALLIDVKLTFPDERTAAEGEVSLKKLLEEARQSIRALLAQSDKLQQWAGFSPKLVGEFELALQTMKVHRDGKAILISQDFRTDLAAVVKEIQENAVNDVRRTAARQIIESNMKQIAGALLEHHRKNGHYPAAAIHDRAGKPLLSWRVALLPYLGAEDLYKQFHLDESWDSPHNRPLLDQMPDVFDVSTVGQKKGPNTYFQVFVGPQAPFEGKREPRAPTSFTDGAGQTLLVVEAAEAVPWTKPSELPYEEKGKLPKLGEHIPEGFHAIMADGSVRLIPHSVSEATLRALITPAAGDKPGDDW